MYETDCKSNKKQLKTSVKKEFKRNTSGKEK